VAWRTFKSVFADGFEGAEVLADPDEAEFRAMGLRPRTGRRALRSLTRSRGRIWRVTYDG
jgi:hypothetical protein